VTPHTAGGSPRRAGRVIETFCENLRQMAAGRVEFLKEIVPKMSRVAFLNPSELDDAFSTLKNARVGGLIVDLTLQEHSRQIVDLALKSRLPTVSGPREFVEAGGLMAYGPHFSDLFRRAATYVAKILKGAKE